MKLSTDATLDRALVMISINSLRLTHMLGLVSGALRGSTAFHKSSFVNYKADIEEFYVEGHRPFPYQLDGDYLGEATRLHFEHVPNILSLVVPNPRLVGLSTKSEQ